jgi:hypothetical protein
MIARLDDLFITALDTMNKLHNSIILDRIDDEDLFIVPSESLRQFVETLAQLTIKYKEFK